MTQGSSLTKPRSPLTAQQRQWVEGATRKVERLARALAPSMPHVNEDDIRGAGFEALVEAATRYDPTRGVTFYGFAHLRVRGAMIDLARRFHPSIRRKKRAERALHATQALLEHAEQTQSTFDTAARTLEQRLEAASELVARATAAVMLSKLVPEDPDDLRAHDGDLESEFLAAEERHMLHTCLDSLSTDDRALMDAIYFRGLTMQRLATTLGVNKSTVSRHHARALSKLSQHLAHLAQERPPPSPGRQSPQNRVESASMASSPIVIYQYPRCSTCRKALKWLDEHSITYKNINIVEQPPSANQLKRARNTANVEIRKLFNTSGQSYREGGWKDKLKALDDPDLFAALAADGKLIKRPLVIGPDFVLIGFNEAEWSERFA